MGYNLSYKLCILNSVVIHLGMKIIDIADKIPNLCQHVMKNCLDWSLLLLFHMYMYRLSLFCTEWLYILKEFEIKKKRKNKGIKHTCTYMLIDCYSWLMEVAISDKYFIVTGIIWSTCYARYNFRIYISILC